MIRFCRNADCGRGFVDVTRKRGEEPPLLCAQCRRGGKPLSRLVGGRSREEAERRQVEKEREQSG